MLRPVRTVRVTTKAELDAALATADQVIVEGDDELLSYAVNKASGDPENRVAVFRTSVPLPPGQIGIAPMAAGLAPHQHADIASAQCRPQCRQLLIVGAHPSNSSPYGEPTE